MGQYWEHALMTCSDNMVWTNTMDDLMQKKHVGIDKHHAIFTERMMYGLLLSNRSCPWKNATDNDILARLLV
jgi:hypothetical protein